MKTLGRDLVTTGSDVAGNAVVRNEAARPRLRRGARHFSGVEKAGPMVERALGRRPLPGAERWPEAVPRLSVAQLTEMAGPLASKAGLRLSSWRAVRLPKTDPSSCCVFRPARISNT